MVFEEFNELCRIADPGKDVPAFSLPQHRSVDVPMSSKRRKLLEVQHSSMRTRFSKPTEAWKPKMKPNAKVLSALRTHSSSQESLNPREAVVGHHAAKPLDVHAHQQRMVSRPSSSMSSSSGISRSSYRPVSAASMHALSQGRSRSAASVLLNNIDDDSDDEEDEYDDDGSDGDCQVDEQKDAVNRKAGLEEVYKINPKSVLVGRITPRTLANPDSKAASFLRAARSTLERVEHNVESLQTIVSAGQSSSDGLDDERVTLDNIHGKYGELFMELAERKAYADDQADLDDFPKEVPIPFMQKSRNMPDERRTPSPKQTHIRSRSTSPISPLSNSVIMPFDRDGDPTTKRIRSSAASRSPEVRGMTSTPKGSSTSGRMLVHSDPHQEVPSLRLSVEKDGSPKPSRLLAPPTFPAQKQLAPIRSRSVSPDPRAEISKDRERGQLIGDKEQDEGDCDHFGGSDEDSATTSTPPAGIGGGLNASIQRPPFPPSADNFSVLEYDDSASADSETDDEEEFKSNLSRRHLKGPATGILSGTASLQAFTALVRSINAAISTLTNSANDDIIREWFAQSSHLENTGDALQTIRQIMDGYKPTAERHSSGPHHSQATRSKQFHQKDVFTQTIPSNFGKQLQSECEVAGVLQARIRAHQTTSMSMIKHSVATIERAFANFSIRQKKKEISVKHNQELLMIWARHVGDPPAKSRKWLLRFIASLCRAKVLFDIQRSQIAMGSMQMTAALTARKERTGSNNMTLPEFLFDHIRQTFGQKRIVEEFCGSLISTLEYYSKQNGDLIVALFTILLQEQWNMAICDVFLACLREFGILTASSSTSLVIDFTRPILLDGEVCLEICKTIFKDWKVLSPVEELMQDVSTDCQQLERIMRKSQAGRQDVVNAYEILLNTPVPVSSKQRPTSSNNRADAPSRTPWFKKDLNRKLQEFRTPHSVFFCAVCRCVLGKLTGKIPTLQSA
eukprot:ANDGO_04246.mRNA.1 hypothetical protein